MPEQGKISFLCNAHLEGIGINPIREQGITFRSASPFEFELSIRASEPKTDPCGDREGLSALLRFDRPAPPEVIEFAASLERGYYINSDKSACALPLIRRGKIYIDENRQISDSFIVPFDLYPEKVQYFVTDTRDTAYTLIREFIHSLRWRQNIPTGHESLSYSLLYWTTDQTPFRVIPEPVIDVSFDAAVGIEWDAPHQSEFQELWNSSQGGEPLGHQLLREAYHLAPIAPLSSILVVVTALEAGVKGFCAELVPGTSWLFEKGPTPPIDRILKDYVRRLIDESPESIDLWNALSDHFSAASKLIEKRNKMAHTGRIPDGTKDAIEYIKIVRDILYAFDILRGHDWAKEWLSRSVRLKMGWPAPRSRRLTVKMKANLYKPPHFRSR